MFTWIQNARLKRIQCRLCNIHLQGCIIKIGYILYHKIMHQIISPAMSYLLQVKLFQGMIDHKEMTLAHLPPPFQMFYWFYITSNSWRNRGAWSDIVPNKAKFSSCGILYIGVATKKRTIQCNNCPSVFFFRFISSVYLTSFFMPW